MITLLLVFGADPASVNHPDAVRILLEAGVDPQLRTRIDDYETPQELADKAGHREIARMLAEAEAASARPHGE